MSPEIGTHSFEGQVKKCIGSRGESRFGYFRRADPQRQITSFFLSILSAPRSWMVDGVWETGIGGGKRERLGRTHTSLATLCEPAPATPMDVHSLGPPPPRPVLRNIKLGATVGRPQTSPSSQKEMLIFLEQGKRDVPRPKSDIHGGLFLLWWDGE